MKHLLFWIGDVLLLVMVLGCVGTEVSRPRSEQPVASTPEDPARVVREFLEAGVDCDREKALSYWGIRPEDVAIHGDLGQRVTLSEIIVALQAIPRPEPGRWDFRLEKLEPDYAEVRQYEYGKWRPELFVLKKIGGRWKIMGTRADSWGKAPH